MSTNYNLNRNNTPPQTPNSNGGFHILKALYIMINGVATGQTIGATKDMIKNGYDRDTMIVLLMYLLLVIYSAQRIYQIHKRLKNDNKDNQNQR